jgi:hypothetical protein
MAEALVRFLTDSEVTIYSTADFERAKSLFLKSYEAS